MATLLGVVVVGIGDDVMLPEDVISDVVFVMSEWFEFVMSFRPNEENILEKLDRVVLFIVSLSVTSTG